MVTVLSCQFPVARMYAETWNLDPGDLVLSEPSFLSLVIV